MCKIWYLGFFHAYPNHALVDRVAVHLDRCGASFHAADPRLSLKEQSIDFLKSNCDWFLVLPSQKDVAEAAVTFAKAIVEADGRQWMEEVRK